MRTSRDANHAGARRDVLLADVPASDDRSTAHPGASADARPTDDLDGVVGGVSAPLTTKPVFGGGGGFSGGGSSGDF